MKARCGKGWLPLRGVCLFIMHAWAITGWHSGSTGWWSERGRVGNVNKWSLTGVTWVFIFCLPNIFIVWPQVLIDLHLYLMRAKMLCDKNLIVHSLFFLPLLSDFVSLVFITWQVYFGTSDWVSSVLVPALESGGKH